MRSVIVIALGLIVFVGFTAYEFGRADGIRWSRSVVFGETTR